MVLVILKTPMTFFVSASSAPKVKTQNSKIIAIFYAVILTVFAVTQLFWFQDMPGVYESFGFSAVAAVAISGGVAALQVLAIPFLLRMRLSIAFRYLSMAAGWLVAIFWFGIALFLVITMKPVATIGMLGAHTPIMPGWWAVFINLALIIMAVWASWGMWPSSSTKK